MRLKFKNFDFLRDCQYSTFDVGRSMSDVQSLLSSGLAKFHISGVASLKSLPNGNLAFEIFRPSTSQYLLLPDSAYQISTRNKHSRLSAGMFFPVNYELTIDNRRQKPPREPSRMIIGGRVTKSQGIKEHCIRFKAFA